MNPSPISLTSRSAPGEDTCNLHSNSTSYDMHARVIEHYKGRFFFYIFISCVKSFNSNKTCIYLNLSIYKYIKRFHLFTLATFIKHFSFIFIIYSLVCYNLMYMYCKGSSFFRFICH